MFYSIVSLEARKKDSVQKREKKIYRPDEGIWNDGSHNAFKLVHMTEHENGKINSKSLARIGSKNSENSKKKKEILQPNVDIKRFVYYIWI